jgi:hypothetical protein
MTTPAQSFRFKTEDANLMKHNASLFGISKSALIVALVRHFDALPIDRKRMLLESVAPISMMQGRKAK